MIVGSGAGNDVASANRINIKSVKAVEIDPVILILGKKYNRLTEWLCKAIRPLRMMK